MWWVLVLSGEFRPGYSDEKRKVLLEQARLLSEAALDPEQPAPVEEDIAPYAAWGGWSAHRLRQREPTRVGPMLMSVLPVMQSTPGVEHVIDVGTIRLHKFDHKRHAPIAVDPSELPRVLDRYGWS